MGRYIRLVDFNSQQEKENAFLVAAADSNCGYAFDCKTEDFDKIPGSPIAYWVSEKIKNLFCSVTIDNVAKPRKGLATMDNNRFFRLWHEVSLDNSIFDAIDRESAKISKKRWVSLSKGGYFRKWYGNREYVINYLNDGEELKYHIVKVYGGGSYTKEIRSEELYFKPLICWTGVSSGLPCFRLNEKGFIFDTSGPAAYATCNVNNILGLLNSGITSKILEIFSPTLSFLAGDIAKIPVIFDEGKMPQIDNIVQENIEISKADWDMGETSWDFEASPLTKSKELDFKSVRGVSYQESIKGISYPEFDRYGSTIKKAYENYKKEVNGRFDKLKANEEELNRLFIEIYGLQDELTPDVADKDVTVARICDTKEEIPASMKGNKYVLTRQDVVKDLISYLVGVAFGRYSLDTEGIAFAGGEFDFSQYITFKPDADGVIPIYNQVGMDNGLTAVIIKLIKVIYGEDSYRENIDFVAESLIKKSNESSEETLNRYLCDEFYADHLKKYKKRPIYWQFCSGKNSGFKCLIYMHRYNSDTLAVINSKYFLPESTRLKNEYDEFAIRIIEADNKDKVRLEKEKSKIFAAYAEALEYGQVLDHMANRYVSIDLDDGVVVNYAKFQSVELVSDSGNKIKKDLLSPIK